MANHQLLDKSQHKKLRVDTRYTAQLGYAMGAVMVTDIELLAAQKEYPIIFRKHAETGRYFPNLMLGFRHDENLFLGEDGQWNATHIPLAVAKGPFLIGFQDLGKGPHPTVSVDLDDPRVSEHGKGEALFLENGESSAYLEYISKILLLLRDGSNSVIKMVDTFVELDLIEPLRLDIQFNNGEKLTFQGGFTIDSEKLAALDKERLWKLKESGFLPAAYYIAGSVENVQKLVDIKNTLSANQLG